MKTQDHEVKGKSALAIGGAVLAGLGASACCTVPLVAVLLGLGGGWMSTLSALEPFRPLFILGAGAFLGYGFWKAYRRPEVGAGACCEEDDACAAVPPARRRFNLVMLWLGALFTVLLIASPYLIPLIAK
jgi:mercuric ion transport protein